MEGESDHTWYQKYEDREHLQEAAKDSAASRVRETLGGQRALHDVLIGAPIPNANDRRGNHHAQPGEIGIFQRAPKCKCCRFFPDDGLQLSPAPEFRKTK